MAGKFKKYITGTICVLLCWALIFAPCLCFANRAFAPSGTAPAALPRQIPSAPVDDKAPPVAVHIAYKAENAEASEVQNTAASDKVLSSLGSGADFYALRPPAKPAKALFRPPQPVYVPPAVKDPPAQSTTVPQSAGTQPSVGKAQLFSGYALLPQPDGTNFVYYDQTWQAYASHPYGAGNVGGSGCGPTSMAMVVSNLTNVRVDPISMADWSRKNGYCVYGRGTAYGLFPAASAQYGISCSTIDRYDKAAIVSALKSGKLLLTVVGYGDFTYGRHFLLIRGITPSGKLLLADSGKYENCLVEWDYDRVLRQVADGFFWVFG